MLSLNIQNIHVKEYLVNYCLCVYVVWDSSWDPRDIS